MNVLLLMKSQALMSGQCKSPSTVRTVAIILIFFSTHGALTTCDKMTVVAANQKPENAMHLDCAFKLNECFCFWLLKNLEQYGQQAIMKQNEYTACCCCCI